MDTVYVETSIVSHATAWPSLDIAVAALQHQAHQWWATESSKFHLVTLQLVITEASAGDPNFVRQSNFLETLMMKNPILDELHAVRRQLLEESGGTIAGLTERLRKEQANSSRPLYDPADNNLMHRSGDGERSSRGEATATAR